MAPVKATVSNRLGLKNRIKQVGFKMYKHSKTEAGPEFMPLPFALRC